jgi:hypothetical protein
MILDLQTLTDKVDSKTQRIEPTHKQGIHIKRGQSSHYIRYGRGHKIGTALAGDRVDELYIVVI